MLLSIQVEPSHLCFWDAVAQFGLTLTIDAHHRRAASVLGVPQWNRLTIPEIDRPVPSDPNPFDDLFAESPAKTAFTYP